VSLFWALPVLVLVLGTALAGVLLGRLTDELGLLDRSLRRAGRIGVQAGDLSIDVAGLHRTAGGLATRIQGTPAPDGVTGTPTGDR
jgi:hypothetical protein